MGIRREVAMVRTTGTIPTILFTLFFKRRAPWS
jgi:hypothetical protein